LGYGLIQSLEQIVGARLVGLPRLSATAPMPDRLEEFRRTAAECLTLAHTTTDPRTRAALIDMAQRLYDRASRPPIDFDAIVQDFNDQKMTGSGSSEPVIQQHQQIQPNKRDDGG
jgi:hypothetical protein